VYVTEMSFTEISMSFISLMSESCLAYECVMLLEPSAETRAPDYVNESYLAHECE